MTTTIFMVLFLLCAVILVLLVLIQRGRGGGLAGAFGGPGGHSAFGTKTADVFIKATAVLGAIFVVLAILTAWLMHRQQTALLEEPAARAPAEEGSGGPAPSAEPTAPPAGETPSEAPAAGGEAGATGQAGGDGDAAAP
ncbi:MAG TPA: preprotein translocase subunit SecG [Phycisphaerae bacterium]|nr:preprotein translocase subunit SecG [Phycisphaerae bacterium]